MRLAALETPCVLEASRRSGEIFRAVLGELSIESAGAPLEERPEQASPGQAGLALAADEDGSLYGLLEEVVSGEVPEMEETHAGWRWRSFRPEVMGLETILETALRRGRPRLWRLPQGGEKRCAVVPLSAPGLRLVPLHRGVSDVRTFESARFLALLHEYVDVQELEASLLSTEGLVAARGQLEEEEPGHHAVLLVLPRGKGKILRFHEALELDHLPAAPRSTTLRSLDLVLLNAVVLRTVLGLNTPERAEGQTVSPVASLEDLVHGVDEGRYQMGFGLNPPPVWEIRAVMEASQRLPPACIRVEPAPPPSLLPLRPW